jgi:hypothetical protein
VRIAQTNDVSTQALGLKFNQCHRAKAIVFMVRQRWTSGIYKQYVVSKFESLDVGIAGDENVDLFASEPFIE